VRSDTVQWAEDDSKSQAKSAKSLFFNLPRPLLSQPFRLPAGRARREGPYPIGRHILPQGRPGGLVLQVWNNLHFFFGADLNLG